MARGWYGSGSTGASAAPPTIARPDVEPGRGGGSRDLVGIGGGTAIRLEFYWNSAGCLPDVYWGSAGCLLDVYGGLYWAWKGVLGRDGLGNHVRVPPLLSARNAKMPTADTLRSRRKDGRALDAPPEGRRARSLLRLSERRRSSSLRMGYWIGRACTDLSGRPDTRVTLVPKRDNW